MSVIWVAILISFWVGAVSGAVVVAFLDAYARRLDKSESEEVLPDVPVTPKPVLTTHAPRS